MREMWDFQRQGCRSRCGCHPVVEPCQRRTRRCQPAHHPQRPVSILTKTVFSLLVLLVSESFQHYSLLHLHTVPEAILHSISMEDNIHPMQQQLDVALRNAFQGHAALAHKSHPGDVGMENVTVMFWADMFLVFVLALCTLLQLPRIYARLSNPGERRYGHFLCAYTLSSFADHAPAH